MALEKAQLEAGLNQAQLEVLRARLNPHFLFNSLQNISVLTKQDPKVASRMLTRLGDLLRAVLRHDSQPESTLREEISLTQAYVALEQMRFGDRLHVNFHIAQEVQEAMVPCFLLQPLIENAIIHGLRGARQTGIITVSGVTQGGRTRFYFVPVNTIDWIESANNYTVLHCHSMDHLSGVNLTTLEHRLNPEQFLRVHRCHIVNISRIVAAHAIAGGVFELELQSKARIKTGRQYGDRIRQLLKAGS